MPSGQAEPPSAWPASPSAWPSSPCDSPAAAGPVPTADDAAVPDPVPSADDAATAAGPAEPAPASPRPAVLTDEDGEPFDAEEFFNPFSGPPEGADAWLAQVAAPVADAWLEARQPPPDGPEALAAGFTRLPAVTAALAAGRIDLPKAMVYHHELAAVADVAAAAIAAVTITDAAGLTTGQLREVLHRAVLAHDPQAAAKRRRKAQKDARVESWAEPRGTAALAGRDLPPAEVLAADKHVDALARELKKAAVPGTLEQLRARVFLALLTSQPLYTLLPGNGQDQDPGGGRAGPGGAGAGNGRPRGVNAGPGGSDQAPGPGGSGPGAHGAGDRPGGIDDGNGEDDGDTGHGNGGTRPPRPGPGPGPSGWPGGRPGLGLRAGLAGSVNLTMPLAAWLGLSDHPGEAAGHGPLDAATTRDLATRLAGRPGNPWCLTITGQDGRAIGHGCARAGPGPPAPGGDPRPRLAALTIHWLETGACGHARQTAAYQPSPALRHLIKTRDRSCAFPGCRRAARRCDDDHTIPTTTAAGPANATWHRFAGGTTPPSKPPAGTSSKPSPAP